MCAFLDALHAYDEYRTDFYYPACRAMDAELVFDDLEERQRLSEKHSIEQHEAKCSGLGSVVLASMRQLIKTPSPAYSDLLHKMEIAHWNDVTNLIDGSALFLTMVEDLKHLVGD